MNEAGRIVDELTRSVVGDPWHGTSVSGILRGITPGIASARAHPQAQPSGSDDASWQRDVTALIDAHDRLLARAATLTDAALHAEPGEDRDRPAGSGVSHYVLLHGLAQHHAYHGGQIALLAKMLGRG